MPHIQTKYGMQYVDQPMLEAIEGMINDRVSAFKQESEALKDNVLSDRVTTLQMTIEQLKQGNAPNNLSYDPKYPSQEDLMKQLDVLNAKLRAQNQELLKLIDKAKLISSFDITNKKVIILDEEWNDQLALKYNEDPKHPNIYLPNVPLGNALEAIGVEASNIEHYTTVEDVIEEFELGIKNNPKRNIDLSESDETDWSTVNSVVKFLNGAVQLYLRNPKG